jgi:hypothetical protein
VTREPTRPVREAWIVEAVRALGPARASRREGPAPAPVAPLAADSIVSRIRAAIDVEARLAVADGVATAEAIDLALRLGAGHPPRTPPLR